MMKKAVVITIGDEILYGQIIDTNTQWIGQQLHQLGFQLVEKLSIGDNKQSILNTIDRVFRKVDIVIVTGGLGPTKDDITKNTLAHYFNSSLVFNEKVYNHLEKLFLKKGRVLSETNKTQAYIPEVCTYIPNEIGTAPGMWFEKNDSVLVSLPGVPFEMKNIMTKEVFPRLKEKFKTEAIVHQIIQVAGIGESNLSDLLVSWEKLLPAHFSLAYLPSLGGVKLRLTGNGKANELKNEIPNLLKLLPEEVKPYIYAFEEKSLEAYIGEFFSAKQLTLAVAESCTGGNIAHLLTSIAGASNFFLGGIVAYQSSIKENILGVSLETIKKYGVVSEAVVLEMAQKCQQKFNSDYAIATTGIAGPGGGSEEIPVGTIWVGIATPKYQKAIAIKLNFHRLENIKLASYTALNLLRKELLGMV